MMRFHTLEKAAMKGWSGRSGWFACLLVFAVGAVWNGEANALEGWHTEWNDARQAAADSGLPILALFTGSDWCPHCQLLEQHVLATDAFHAWAEGRVVPLVIDLPRHGLPQAVRDERSALCRRYGVKSFPNVLLIAPDGAKIAAQPGYNRQSPETWFAAMDRHLAVPPAAATVAEQATLGPPGQKIDAAVREATNARRPVLVVVSRASDQDGRIRAASLVNDPEFRDFAADNFVVAAVEAGGDAVADEAPPVPAEPLGSLLGGVPLPSDEVEVIVTYDGRTPMYTQSARQPTPRIISGLRRFLGARPGGVRR